MRIAMIGAKGIPASMALGGGIEIHVERLASHLAERGHQVTVYVRPYANPQRRKSWNRIRLITLPTIRRKNLDAIAHVFLASVHVLFQKADIIHYHGVGPSILSWIPRVFKPSAKIVCTFHARDQFHEKWSWFARLVLAFGEYATCTFPHRTIAVSHDLQIFGEGMFRRRIDHVPNGVEIPRRNVGTSRLKRLGLEPNGYLMTLGRLVPVKAHEDAISAFRTLMTDKKLLIVGDASYDTAEYEAALKKLAAPDPRIVLMGRRSGDELMELIAHCYALVHCSRTEGLSVAILEAMSHGRLVVMSDIPGNRELVDHSGIAYPVGNVKELRRVLEWILADPVLAHIRGERARDVVRRLYAWDRVTDSTLRVYEDALHPIDI
ncbi:glycosyltransferase family 4 protein [Candidatus Uhrbacteria bacterium]|nr:glycosyltransferase family 4 protein [Candidatus Uhrbacteria bacterium]